MLREGILNHSHNFVHSLAGNIQGFEVDVTLDDIQEFFEPMGSESVFMRRVPLSKQFKGSVFVTFKTQKEADDFMNQTETKYNDSVLTKMTKTAYYDSKKDEKNPSTYILHPVIVIRHVLYYDFRPKAK